MKKRTLTLTPRFSGVVDGGAKTQPFQRFPNSWAHGKTVETVTSLFGDPATLLKQGVNKTHESS